jgi:OOP family OmpA-OmpF porin
MKKFTLLVVAFFVASITFAQETSEDTKSNSDKDYNKFSIEANVGSNKPDDNFSPGYFSSDKGEAFPFNSISHFDLGVRYMFNERFGLKLDGAYDVFEPQGDTSLPFETTQLRFGLQGVVNLRNILKFNTFSGRLGLLGHAGVQVNFLSPESRGGIDTSSNETDQNGGFIFGLTPQFRITDRFVITADASFIQNYRSHITWDGFRDDSVGNLDSSMMNVSLGLTVYLGKHDIHADWYNVEEDMPNNEDLEKIRNRLDDIESKMKDDDKDGVPNYLDKDPNTPAGVIVNTKGQSTDANSNGIPDSMEGPLDNKYITKGSDINLVKELANKEVIAVYFDFDVSVPQEDSYADIRAVMTYMRANPSSKVTITGYADELGTVDYNNPLSERRAVKVHDILVSAGIDASRITAIGGGVDDSVDKSSEYARQLVRRATFMIE